MNLRKWQDDCLNDWKNSGKRDYLINATPGAGKTTMALMIAKTAMSYGIKRFFFIVPTDNLRDQWRESAIDYGINLDPEPFAGKERSDFNGVVTTYQSVSVNPDLFRAGTDTMVVFDEIHHAGEGAWGQSIQRAFQNAKLRLSLSGTPFRSDNSYIPFVNYESKNGIDICKADFSYSYPDALSDGIVKTIEFYGIDGNAQWADSFGEYGEKISDESQANRSKRLRTAFSTESDWMKESLSRANETLDWIREEIRPDTAGIIFVENIYSAKKFESDKELHSILGEIPTVVYSENSESHALIEKFKRGKSKWIVSVQQISEGVDIPRLSVMVLAAGNRTDLLFRQRIGRVLRKQSEVAVENGVAYCYIPDDLIIKELAASVEREIIAFAKDEERKEKESRRTQTELLLDDYISRGVKDVEFSTVIISGEKHSIDAIIRLVSKNTGVSIENAAKIIIDYNKLTGKTTARDMSDPEEKNIDIFKEKQILSEHETKWARKLGGILKSQGHKEPFKEINFELVRIIGKRKSECSNDELKERINILKRWVNEGSVRR